MALNQLTIIHDLHLFQGNPRPTEPRFVPDIDARIFLRSVEIYFEQHNITSNEKVLQIVFSLIEKHRGDAIKLITCYAGKKIPFFQFKSEFLAMYPVFTIDEFKHEAQGLLSTKLKSEDMFCTMITLENASVAVAEAYLESEKLTNKEFNET